MREKLLNALIEKAQDKDIVGFFKFNVKGNLIWDIPDYLYVSSEFLSLIYRVIKKHGFKGTYRINLTNDYIRTVFVIEEIKK